ncbi:MAG: rhodanese-like domain-containing protein, partial [Acidimicrobiales bacterium]
RLMVLPDDLAVFPTHGAGSFCSAAGSTERTTTVGAERAHNALLAAGNEDVFVNRLVASLGTYPPYFLRLRDLNRRGPRIVGGTPLPVRLSVTELRKMVDQGAQVVDARSVGEFASGHVPGSLSIPLRPQFASWLGWLVKSDRPVVFVLGPDQDRRALVSQCLGIGYERLAGELEGGVAAWQDAGLALESLTVVDAPALGSPGSGGRLLLDVRQVSEYDAGHIPGSLHVELGSLADSVAQLPAQPLAVLCGHGERAVTGASIISGLGRHDVAVVTGGPEDWAAVPGRRLASGD